MQGLFIDKDLHLSLARLAYLQAGSQPGPIRNLVVEQWFHLFNFCI